MICSVAEWCNEKSVTHVCHVSVQLCVTPVLRYFKSASLSVLYESDGLCVEWRAYVEVTGE